MIKTKTLSILAIWAIVGVLAFLLHFNNGEETLTLITIAIVAVFGCVFSLLIVDI